MGRLKQIIQFFKGLKPASVFVVLAVLCSVGYTLIRPPFQTPDEYAHFCRAYQISEGGFLPEATNHRVGGALPMSIKEYYSYFEALTLMPNYKMNTAQVFSFSGNVCTDSSRVFIDFPNTGNYSPIAYFPQSLSLFVTRQLQCSIAVCFFVTKLIGLLFFIFCLYYAISITPVYKWLFVAVALLPMNIFLMNAFTADLVSNSLAFLLMALIFRARFIDSHNFKRVLLVLFLIGIVLALCKVVHIALLSLMLMIPFEKFGSRLKKVGLILIICAVPLLLSKLWSDTALAYFPTTKEYHPDFKKNITLHPEANAKLQMEHLKANKLHLLKLAYNGLVTEPTGYLSSYVARFGTYQEIEIDSWVVVCTLIVLLIIGLFEKNEFVFSWTDRLLLLFAATITYLLLTLSQHLVWNSVGSETMMPFQGRYFSSIIPLLLMMLGTRLFNFNPMSLVVLGGLCLNGAALKLLHKRYVDDTCKQKIELQCGAEEVNSKGELKTNCDTISLSGGDRRSSKFHHTGKYSIVMLPDSSDAFRFSFRNLKLKDLVVISAWQKGTGARIEVDCEIISNVGYYINSKDIVFTDQNGWNKMQMIFPMFYDCDSSRVAFSIRNIGKDTIYLDDVEYLLKRY